MNAKIITLILLSGFLILSGCLENVSEEDTSAGDTETDVTVVYLDNSSSNLKTVTIEKDYNETMVKVFSPDNSSFNPKTVTIEKGDNETTVKVVYLDNSSFDPEKVTVEKGDNEITIKVVYDDFSFDPETATTGTDDIQTRETIVYLDNSSFHPETVTIDKGETVKWINNDTAASVISGESFQSPALRRGDSYSVTFDNRGTYTYFLISHPWTRGGMVVVE